MTPSATPSAPPVRVAVHDIGQLAAAVPYLLGYAPAGGIVALGMSRPADGRRTMLLGPTGRVDLTGIRLATLRRAGAARLAGELWRRMAPRLVDQCDALVLLGWADGSIDAGATDASTWTLLLRELADHVDAAGLEVMDLALVGEGRWRPVTCDDPGCCPPDPIELPLPHQVSAVAAMVAEGCAPFPDRVAVTAQVAHREDDPRSRLVRAALRQGEAFGAACPGPWADLDPERGCAAWARLLAVEEASSGGSDQQWAKDVAAAAVLVEDVRARDVVLGWLCPDLWTDDLQDPDLLVIAGRGLGPRLRPELGPEVAHAVLARMVAMCAALPDPESADVLTLTGMLAWAQQEPVLAEGAFTRALAADAGQSLARMMLRALTGGLTYARLVEGSRTMG